jgi:hypothetical protein
MTGFAHAAEYLRTAAAPRHGEWLSGLWPTAGRVAICLGYIGIILFVFTSLQDRTESITVALIGLVFASLRATTLGSACAQRRIAFLLESEIKQVRRTIAQGVPSSTVSDAEFDRALDALVKPARIEYVGLAVVASICLYQLTLAVIYGIAYQQIFES